MKVMNIANARGVNNSISLTKTPQTVLNKRSELIQRLVYRDTTHPVTHPVGVGEIKPCWTPKCTIS